MPKLIPGYRDEVKEKILEATWDVLNEKSAQDLTMDDIARSLNCSKGALYNYFANKDDLLEVALTTIPTRFQEELFSRFSGGEFISNAADYFDNEMLHSSKKMHLDILMESMKNERVKKALTFKYNKVLDSIVELFKKLTHTGQIKLKQDALTTARFFYALRYGIMISLLYGLTKEDARKAWIHGMESLLEN